MTEFYILRSKKKSGGKNGEGTDTLLDLPFIADSNNKLTIIHGLDSEGNILVPGNICRQLPALVADERYVH